MNESIRSSPCNPDIDDGPTSGNVDEHSTLRFGLEGDTITWFGVIDCGD
jgi:hypothetical protein